MGGYVETIKLEPDGILHIFDNYINTLGHQPTSTSLCLRLFYIDKYLKGEIVSTAYNRLAKTI